nr:MAG TPA: hypothetical protein [Caudoviricetes sp.]
MILHFLRERLHQLCGQKLNFASILLTNNLCLSRCSVKGLEQIGVMRSCET